MVDSGTFKTTSYLQESSYLDNAMSVLLSNSDKSHMGNLPGADRHIDPNVDLGRLDICFGGFSPTAMGSNIPAVREAAEAVERRQIALREARERAAAVEAARASDVRELVDGKTTWQYVVLDDHEVRIERCSTSSAELVLPESIEDKPVVAIASEACAELESVSAIKMPSSIIAIGYCAFRGCPELRSIQFSSHLSAFDAGWLRACPQVEHVVLPGKLEKIVPSILDLPSLRVLEIGEGAAEVMPGAFAKSALERIEVSDANTALSSDGLAVYAGNRSILLALAVPVESYEVAPECVAIARKGLSAFECLADIKVHDGLELIGDFAFTRTSISRFDAPPSLKAIGERAFFACNKLEHVTLNKKLELIGANAFSDTGIHELFIPASVIEFGWPIASDTSVTYSGKGASFRIASEPDALLSIDEHGGLYRNAQDGLHLVRMLEPQIAQYEVAPGTVEIDDGAFTKHPAIESVVIPEGVVRIGRGAFRDCRKLTNVELPESLKTIDEEAFLDTSLESLRIPAALTRIGAIALITYGAHHTGIEPSLRHVEVDPANPKYYMECGLLIEHMDGFDRVILCTGEVPDVVVPDSVTNIASYAFNGVRRLRTLTLNERIAAVDVRGLAFDCLLENIHVDLTQPIEGHIFFDFKFPQTARGAQQMGHAFGSPNFVNVESIFDHYDNSIVNRSGFDAKTGDAVLSAYEQGVRIVERLLDPVFMSPTNRSLMESAMRSHLTEICTDAARHDDKSVIEGMLDLGFIDLDNIDEAIDAVGRIQDASITNYLLEQKRRRFGARGIDFDL